MLKPNAIKKLNVETFAAEVQGEKGEETKVGDEDEDWDKFLWRVLSDDFRIKRSNPAILPQDKHRMLAHITYGGKSAYLWR